MLKKETTNDIDSLFEAVRILEHKEREALDKAIEILGKLKGETEGED